MFGDFENGALLGPPGGPIGILSARLPGQLFSPTYVLDQVAGAIQTAVASYNETQKNKPDYYRVGVQGDPFFDPMLTPYAYEDGNGITQNRQYRIEQNLFSDVTTLRPDLKITLALNVLVGKVMKSLNPSVPPPRWSVATESPL